MTASRWYAVHTNARAEWLAHRSLQAKGIETFYPHVAGTVRHGRRAIGVLKPYFTRYLFARVGEGQSLYEVNTTMGVSCIVTAGASPLVVPDDVVAAIAGRADQSGKIDVKPPPAAPRWQPGDRVRLIGGPFLGLMAEVAKIDDSPVVRVWIEAFGRIVEATLPERDLGGPQRSPDRRSVVSSAISE